MMRRHALKEQWQTKNKKAIEIAKRRDSAWQSKDERVMAGLQRKIERAQRTQRWPIETIFNLSPSC